MSPLTLTLALLLGSARGAEMPEPSPLLAGDAVALAPMERAERGHPAKPTRSSKPRTPSRTSRGPSSSSRSPSPSSRGPTRKPSTSSSGPSRSSRPTTTRGPSSSSTGSSDSTRSPTPSSRPAPSTTPDSAGRTPTSASPSSSGGTRTTRPDAGGLERSSRSVPPGQASSREGLGAPRSGTAVSGSTRQGATARPTAPPSLRNTVSGPSVERPSLGDRPSGGTRPYTSSGSSSSASRPDGVPPHRSGDVRYSRPSVVHVHSHPHAHHHVPHVWWYRPWYTRWYCHPYYRYQYATVAVVSFGFGVHAWVDWWTPPARAGWVWVPGYWSWGYWHPGYWAPVTTGPVGYVYVPGWWENEVYVEGYYRTSERDGWRWVEGYYLEDGTYVRGHWQPAGRAPEGYVWEPGFWDGEMYVDGFWRPELRSDYTWVSAYYDDAGVFHSGYWMPVYDRAGQVWVPGWFDGNEWVEGYWVSENEYRSTDLESWEPEEGYDAGWAPGEGFGDGEVLENNSAVPEARIIEQRIEETGEAPLAVPVVPPAGG